MTRWCPDFQGGDRRRESTLLAAMDIPATRAAPGAPPQQADDASTGAAQCHPSYLPSPCPGDLRERSMIEVPHSGAVQHGSLPLLYWESSLQTPLPPLHPLTSTRMLHTPTGFAYFVACARNCPTSGAVAARKLQDPAPSDRSDHRPGSKLGHILLKPRFGGRVRLTDEDASSVRHWKILADVGGAVEAAAEDASGLPCESLRIAFVALTAASLSFPPSQSLPP